MTQEQATKSMYALAALSQTVKHIECANEECCAELVIQFDDDLDAALAPRPPYPPVRPIMRAIAARGWFSVFTVRDGVRRQLDYCEPCFTEEYVEPARNGHAVINGDAMQAVLNRAAWRAIEVLQSSKYLAQVPR